MKMILVIGATGAIGSQLVPQLIEADQRVRVFTRNPEKAAKFGSAVEVVVGNLDDENSLIPAMQGVDRFFLITSSTQQDKNALAAAKQAGTGHVVKISTQEAGWTPVEGHGHWHKEREDLIRASGLAWTFLRSTLYMNFALSWISSIRAENTIRVAGGNGKLAPIDPWDVAAVAKAALTEAGHENAAYELTGPELLSFGDMAEVLSKASGRSIRRVEISEAEQGEFFTKMGLPKYTVDGLAETFGLIGKGRFAYMTNDVEKTTGQRPHSFERWAQQHVRAFQ
jgi:(4-alkanoyl-5-oxo-2,5-dihydrofuran-3-yl)methyl phosphate reductase